MIYNVIFSLLICISSLTISMDTNPNDHNNPYYLTAIACQPKNKVALFSTNNFDIFDQKTSKSIYHMSLGNNYSFDMGTNKEKNLLALSFGCGYPKIHNVETGENQIIEFPVKNFYPNDPNNTNAIDINPFIKLKGKRINLLKKNDIAINFNATDTASQHIIWPVFALDFCPTNNTFFFYDFGLFVSYNISDQKTTTFNVPVGSGAFFPIDCNPTNTELIRFFDSRTLEILESNQNFQKKMSLKTDFECKAAAYAPDGHTLAILGCRNDKANPCYFICDLSDKRSPKPAYQMINPEDSTDLKYITGKFHPYLPLFVALSQCGDLRFFNYITRKCVSKEKIFSDKIGQAPFSQRCLDFDENGNVLIGYDKTWITSKLPQVNPDSTSLSHEYDQDIIQYEQKILSEEDVTNSNASTQEPHIMKIKAIYVKP
jgi:hypothetical protein